MTHIINVNNITPQDKKTVHAVLNDGGVIAYPTDTVYGLGIDVKNESALLTLHEMKGRDENKPISVLYNHVNSVLKDFHHLNDFQKKVVKTMLPGAVTLVLPVDESQGFSHAFCKDGYTGVRVIDKKDINSLLKNYPNPISTTSINPAGLAPARTLDEIQAYFPSQIDLIVDGGASMNATASTILKVLDDTILPLRVGCVPMTLVYKKLGIERLNNYF